jgi:hypothetical protein
MPFQVEWSMCPAPVKITRHDVRKYGAKNRHEQQDSVADVMRNGHIQINSHERSPPASPTLNTGHQPQTRIRQPANRV